MRDINPIIRDTDKDTLKELRQLLELARINQMSINDLLDIINNYIYKK